MGNTKPPLEDPHAALERVIMDEFLTARGHTRHSVAELPASERVMLLTAAAEHASLRLAEIEARAHYVDKIHGTS